MGAEKLLIKQQLIIVTSKDIDYISNDRCFYYVEKECGDARNDLTGGQTGVCGTRLGVKQGFAGPDWLSNRGLRDF